MKPLIIPAILASDCKDLQSKLQRIPHAPCVQIDVLDNTLVPNHSFYDVSSVSTETSIPLIELHLMAADPLSVIQTWIEHPRLQRLIWHREAPIDHHRLIAQCRQANKEVGLALMPATPINELESFIPFLDEVLLLGVDPGFSGQSLKPETIEKTRALHSRIPTLVIGFDGGVRPHHFRDLLVAGVSRIYMASAIFRDEDPDSLLETQQSLLDALSLP